MKQSATHSERERFVADLVRHAPAADSVIAGRLMRYAGAYHRLAASESQLTFGELRKLERVRNKFEKLCEQVDCFAVFNGPDSLISVPGDEILLGVPRI